MADWIAAKAEVRRAPGPVPQGAFVLRDSQGQAALALLGSLALTTDGLGTFAVASSSDVEVPPGMVFCLRAECDGDKVAVDESYPLKPHFLVHVGEDGSVLLPYTQAKRILDRLKRICVGRDLPDAGACSRFDRDTGDGADMSRAQSQLAAAVASVAGKSEERAVASLFQPGGTHGLAGEFAGIDDFEVVAFLVVVRNADLPNVPGA